MAANPEACQEEKYEMSLQKSLLYPRERVQSVSSSTADPLSHTFRVDLPKNLKMSSGNDENIYQYK